MLAAEKRHKLVAIDTMVQIKTVECTDKDARAHKIRHRQVCTQKIQIQGLGFPESKSRWLRVRGRLSPVFILCHCPDISKHYTLPL